MRSNNGSREESSGFRWSREGIIVLSSGEKQETSHLIMSSENSVHRILIFTCSKPFHREASDPTSEVVLSSSLLRLAHIYENQTQPPGCQRRCGSWQMRRRGGLMSWVWFSDRRTGALEKSISLIIIQGEWFHQDWTCRHWTNKSVTGSLQI